MEYPSPKDGDLPVSRFSPRHLRSELILIAIFLGVTLGLLFLCKHALASPAPVVRVMVDREPSALRISGFDLEVIEAGTGRRLAQPSRRGTVALSCSLGGAMTLQAGGAKVRASGPVRVSSRGGFIRVGASQYRDELYVYSFNGDCIAVNHVDLEQYVAGVLDSEMNSKWSLQTLMAQAIAARTYAIYQMREASTTRFRGLQPPFDLASTVKDQVYEGAHHETYRAEKVIAATRGQVLTYEGRPIKAFYHSTCGGHTETPDRVWGVHLPYLHSVQCEYCRASPRYNWVYAIPGAELERKLRVLGLLRGNLLSLQVVSRNGLGRAAMVEVRGSGGTMLLAATRLRDVIGTLNVRSTDFNIARNPVGGLHGADFVFMGHGSGHGVGMCQWGAKTMGDMGYSHSQILSHYYPDARIAKIY